MNRSRRRLVLVLVAVGLVVAYAAVLAYIMWGDWPGRRAPAAPVRPVPTSPVVELWHAYQQARAAAGAEAADAELVSASTQWQGQSEQAMLEGTGNWSFVFYSAASSGVLDVTARAGEAQVVKETRVWVAPAVLGEGGWQEGPRDALLVFLAYGGREFLEAHPQAVVDLHLAEGDGGGPQWSVTALDVSDRGVVSVVVDADTMGVLAITP